MTNSGILRFLRSFASGRDGNVAVIFALATIPVFGLIGVAVDYNRAADVRTAMQAAIDSTALMLSREAQGLSEADLKTKATDYFNSNFKRSEAKGLVVTPTLTQPGQGTWSLTVKASAQDDTVILRSLNKTTGINAPAQLAVGASSQVQWGLKKLEIALALDNTGSMAWAGKMSELKKAVKSLLTTLKAAEKVSGDIKVAIIPFDTGVNIGDGYKDKDWFDIDSIDCNGWKKKGNGCTKSSWKSHWDGCVRDRQYPYDVQDDPPSSSKKQTLIPVHECDDLAEAMPLSSDWTKLNQRVDAMAPNGNTNVTIGLVWAWHSLTTQDPYSEASIPKTDLDKVIILLTDGENTEAWNNASNQKVTSVSHIDNRTRKACENVKAASIKLYTVRVIEGNADLLRECASNPGMYYDVQQASDLNAVFTAIAKSLASLYIAK
jgi:Flp pilus assembly protein TadG